MTTDRFSHDLAHLMRAPYALLQIETFEEARALDTIARICATQGRPHWVWSSTRGFQGSDSGIDFFGALDSIEQAQDQGVFVFCDALGMLEDSHVLRRRLREAEPGCAASRKTLIFLTPRKVELLELAKEMTTLTMPLPNRAQITECCHRIFPQEVPGCPREAMITGAMGLTLKEATRAFWRVRGRVEEGPGEGFDAAEAILEEKRRLIQHNEALEFHPLREGMDEVGGLEELKRWLGTRAAAFSTRARDFGLPTPKGLLLVGVQGCGKSLTAKAIAKYWGLPLLRLDLGRVFDGKHSAEQALRMALDTSEAMSPCVLWIDELEKGFAQHGEGRAQRVLGSLLTWLQEKESPVFLVATANDVTVLPPELLRKGRFDEIFFVDLPELHAREQILRIHLAQRGRQMPKDVVGELAQKCEYFSGSELEQVVLSGLYMAFEAGRELAAEDLGYAARDMIPLYRTYEEQIKALREWAMQRARPAAARRKVLDFFRG